MSGRSYSIKTIKTLFARSGNRCAYPGCDVKLTIESPETDSYSTLGEIAHILPVGNNGPRHEYRTDNVDLNNPNNLILLCPNHHGEVDSDPTRFTPKLLRRYKIDHEREVELDLFRGDSIRDVEAIKSLADVVTFDWESPEDYVRISRLLEKGNLQEVFRHHVSRGVDDKPVLLRFGINYAEYLQCTGRDREAKPILEACLEMHKKGVLPQGSAEAVNSERYLLHSLLGDDDEHESEVNFCEANFGITDRRTIKAKICKACVQMRGGKLDRAKAVLNNCQVLAEKSGRSNPEITALLKFQKGKLLFLFGRLEKHRSPKRKNLISKSIDLLKTAQSQLDSISPSSIYRFFIRFFLVLCYEEMGYIEEAKKNQELARTFFMGSPIAGMCHYDDDTLREILGLPPRSDST